MVKEALTSRRLSIINHNMKDLYDKVDELSESLVDRDEVEALHTIVDLKEHLKLIQNQIIDGDLK